MNKHFFGICLLLAVYGNLSAQLLEGWFADYRGVCAAVNAEGEFSAEIPFTLRIGGKGEGTVTLLTREDQIDLRIVNLDRRQAHQPPTVTEELFLIPATLAEPVKVEILRVPGEFNEMLLQGRIDQYSVFVDKEPELLRSFVFKAGKVY